MDIAKHRNKRNRNKHKLQKDGIGAFMPLLVVMGFILLTGAGLYKLWDFKNILEEQVWRYDEEEGIWDEAFKEAESKKVGVMFEIIQTEQQVYLQLHKEIEGYLRDVENMPDIIVQTRPVMNEQTFVDKKVNEKGEVSDRELTFVEMVETGPMYFSEMSLLRYVDEAGHLKVVVAEQKEGVEGEVLNKVSNKKDFLTEIGYSRKEEAEKREQRRKEMENTQQQKQKDIDEAFGTGKKESKANQELKQQNANSLISEGQYLKDVSSLIERLIEADTRKQLQDAEKAAIPYFTLDGKKAVLSLKTQLGGVGVNLETTYIEAGKSMMEMGHKYRVLICVTASPKENTQGESVEQKQEQGKRRVERKDYMVILKLNKNSKVFDIDVISS